MGLDNFPDLPTIKIVRGKANTFTWSFADGTTTFSATTEIECTPIGLEKSCTLQNSDLEATVTIKDSDLTLGTITQGTFTYILQTDDGTDETPVSWLGKLVLYTEP